MVKSSERIERRKKKKMAIIGEKPQRNRSALMLIAIGDAIKLRVGAFHLSIQKSAFISPRQNEWLLQKLI